MRARYDDFYILDDNDNPVPADWRQWAEWLEANSKRRRIVREKPTEGSEVSTCFLGVDYQFGDGPPILFETMVFGGPLDGEQERYSTRAEALEGHGRMVERVREAMAKDGGE